MKTKLLMFVVLVVGFACTHQDRQDRQDRQTEKKRNSNKSIPPHTYFINSNTIYDDLNIDPDLPKKISKNESDTLVILTNEKIIFIIGQYGIQNNDSIIIPCSGEFGIRYEVRDNKGYNLDTTTMINLGKQKFTKNKLVNFQWWPEIIDSIYFNGQRLVIVSGP
jgi:hypothetical protein